MSPEKPASFKSDLQEIDWSGVTHDLNESGHAILPGLLKASTCTALAKEFDNGNLFRNEVDMARYNFGRGVYRYYAYPLSPLISALRSELYPPLSTIANDWQKALGREERFPRVHADYLSRCHAAGQKRPTPLLLRYGPGDYNCLHQDRYGDELFPLQVAILLSRPNSDFEGGEFVLTEQRPRMQSRVEVVPLTQGDAVVFAVTERPVKGTRGYYRVNTRHGVSRIRSGHRVTLGIIFHDAT